jgi:hypothetical protein
MIPAVAKIKSFSTTLSHVCINKACMCLSNIKMWQHKQEKTAEVCPVGGYASSSKRECVTIPQVSLFLYIYIYICICIYMYEWMNVCVVMCVHIYIYVCVCVCVCMYVCMYVCMRGHVCVHAPLGNTLLSLKRRVSPARSLRVRVCMSVCACVRMCALLCVCASMWNMLCVYMLVGVCMHAWSVGGYTFSSGKH